MLSLQVTAVTHRGKQRDHNEDTVAVDGFCSSAAEGEPARVLITADRPLSCLVADGLGGHAEGARASGLAARVISDAASKSAEPDALIRAFEAANAAIFQEMDCCGAWHGMGTTAVGTFFDEHQLTCVNIGDSRCYQIVGPTVVQLSTDDSPPPLLEDPSAPVAVVTQTLGGTPEPVAISPHVHSMKVAPGDRFLLCSDGLTDCVPLDDIEQRLAGAGDDLAQVRALLDAALNAGGPDNISIVLITVQE